ncbi:MAG: pitrilysin family protein [Bdellovibrionales bacterium]|nr:pitrilysin family protein [Bdellovibrionales bacterium]
MDSKNSLFQYELQKAGQATVLFFKDDKLPYIRYDLLFLKGGADFSSKPGLASITSHLLDQGAGGLSSEEIQEKLNSYGVELSLDLERQNCFLSLSGLSQHKENLWELFKKIIAEPHFDLKELEVLKKQYSISRMEKFNSPSSIAIEVWRKEIFPKHPYGEPKSGTLPSLKEISLEEVKKFYQKQYKESAPVFIVVGQYDEALKTDILSFLKKHFNTDKLSASHSPVTTEKTGKTLLITRKDLVQSELIAGYALPPYPTTHPEKILALNLANNIFGGSFNSKLVLHLREERGLAYSVTSSFTFNRKYGFFILDGATKTQSTGYFLKEALALLQSFKEKGLTEKELSDSKNSLKGQFLRQMETMEYKARMFVYYHFQLGLKKDYLSNYLKLIDSISLKEVNQVIKEYTFPDKLHIVIYGHPSVEEQLKNLEIPALQVIPFKERFAGELP